MSACCCLQIESGRYHIYIGNACPWCHRVLLALIVRGLTQHISVTWAADDPERASRGGWVFNSPEPVFGKNDLRCALFALCSCLWPQAGTSCNIAQQLQMRISMAW